MEDKRLQQRRQQRLQVQESSSSDDDPDDAAKFKMGFGLRHQTDQNPSMASLHGVQDAQDKPGIGQPFSLNQMEAELQRFTKNFQAGSDDRMFLTGADFDQHLIEKQVLDKEPKSKKSKQGGDAITKKKREYLDEQEYYSKEELDEEFKHAIESKKTTLALGIFESLSKKSFGAKKLEYMKQLVSACSVGGF